MKTEDLINLKVQLTKRLAAIEGEKEALEAEKGQVTRKLKAVDVLLEGSAEAALAEAQTAGQEVFALQPGLNASVSRKRTRPSHAVRYSPRISLIGAVKELAAKQPGSFVSGDILKAIQDVYPELNVTETKHISRPLSDLVKEGLLTRERKRGAGRANIYRLAGKV